MNFLGAISTGGPIMLVLLVVSIFSLALVLLKLLEFNRMRLKEVVSGRKIAERLQEVGVASTISELKAQPSPLAQIGASALDLCLDEELSEEEREKTLALICSQELRKMENGLGAVSVIAHVAPLLGLLGTVTGMIKAFQALETSGMRAEAGILAGGIWEALLTTAFGLIIAIPLLAAFHYFESRVDSVANQMQLLAADILKRFRPRQAKAEDISAISASAERGFTSVQ